MARIGIVGPANSGKTTLFNALTGHQALAAPHPFSTTEPNVGVAKVADPELDRIADIEGSAKTTYATLDLVDLPAGGQHGGGLGSQFLGRLREVEAMAAVVRSFEDESVPFEAGSPAQQASDLILELALADHEIFDRRKDKIAKEATADRSLAAAADAIARAADHLGEGHALRSGQWTDVDQAAFRDLAPLTMKPTVWVVNVDESDDGSAAADLAKDVPAGDVVISLSARLEEEAAQLPPEDRAELYEGFGMGGGALAAMVDASYDALGLISFYTIGPKESHAWTVRRAATAPEAAGKIHSDLERGFIRAEVAQLTDVIEAGGWDAAKAAGIVAVEGKDYVVQPADVLLIRFSV